MISLRAVTFARRHVCAPGALYIMEWIAALAAWRMDDAWLGALLPLGDHG
jgi:hypothetical protein